MTKRRGRLARLGRIVVMAILALCMITVLGMWVIGVLDNPGSLPSN